MQKKKIYLIIVLVLVILILLFLRASAQNNPPVVTISPTPKQEPAQPPSPTTLRPVSSVIKRNIIKKLPITTEGYTIQYLDKGDEFLVIMLLNPYEKYKKEASSWFLQNGVQNLSSLNIQWDSIRGVPATE